MSKRDAILAFFKVGRRVVSNGLFPTLLCLFPQNSNALGRGHRFHRFTQLDADPFPIPIRAVRALGLDRRTERICGDQDLSARSVATRRLMLGFGPKFRSRATGSCVAFRAFRVCAT